MLCLYILLYFQESIKSSVRNTTTILSQQFMPIEDFYPFMEERLTMVAHCADTLPIEI